VVILFSPLKREDYRFKWLAVIRWDDSFVLYDELDAANVCRQNFLSMDAGTKRLRCHPERYGKVAKVSQGQRYVIS